MTRLVSYLIILILRLGNTAGSKQLNPSNDLEFSSYTVNTSYTESHLMQLSSLTWYASQLSYPQGLTFSNQHILIKSPQSNKEYVSYDTFQSKPLGEKEILVKFDSESRKVIIESNGYPDLTIIRTREDKRQFFYLQKDNKGKGNPKVSIGCIMEDMFELFPLKKDVEKIVKAVKTKKKQTEDFIPEIASSLKEKRNFYYLKWVIGKPTRVLFSQIPLNEENKALKWYLDTLCGNLQSVNQWFIAKSIFRSNPVNPDNLRFAFADLGQDLCPFALRMQNQRYRVIFQGHCISVWGSVKHLVGSNQAEINDTDNLATFTIKDNKLISRLNDDPIVSALVMRGKERFHSSHKMPPLSLKEGDRILFSVAGPKLTDDYISTLNTVEEAFEMLKMSHVVELVIIKENQTGGNSDNKSQDEHYKSQVISTNPDDSHSDQKSVILSQCRGESIPLKLNSVHKKEFLEIAPMVLKNQRGFSLSLPELESKSTQDRGQIINFPGEMITLTEHGLGKRISESQVLDDSSMDWFTKRLDRLTLASAEISEEIRARFNESKVRKRQPFSKKKKPEVN